MVFLVLLVLVLVKYVFFQVHIVGVEFLVLITTFLEKFSLLYNLISSQSVCHNEFRENMCCS